MIHPTVCPHCGEDLPKRAISCPACGSDHQTGWSDDATVAENPWATPDDDEYREIYEREFGTRETIPFGRKNRGHPPRRLPTKQQWITGIAAALALLMLLGYFL